MNNFKIYFVREIGIGLDFLGVVHLTLVACTMFLDGV